MKQMYKHITDALRMLHKLDKGLIPSVVAASILKACVPFIAILLSAYVLDSLTTGVAFERIIGTALAGAAAAFGISLLAGWLEKYKGAHEDATYWQWENLTGEKSLSLDYQQLEEPDAAQLRDRMNKDRGWGGIYTALTKLGSIVGSLCELVFSAVILLPLLRDRVFYSNWSSAIYCFVSIGLTIGVIVFKFAYENKRHKEHMSSTPHAFRLTDYFIWSGFDYRFGKDIRIYHAQPLIRNTVENARYKADVKAETARISVATGLSHSLGGIADALIMGGAYLCVILLAVAGGLSIGMVVRSAAVFYRFAAGIMGLFIELSWLAIDTQRLQSKFEYLSLPNMLHQGTLTTEKRADNDYAIEFHDVSFKYPGSNAYALRNFSLKLNVGERLAVVGMNGSGKTTMIKLLCRLYDPTEGIITLNGIDIKKYDYEEYMGIFSVVFQDFKLFSFPLGQNVASSYDVDTAKAEECLIKAGLEERLRGMPEGLNTYLYKDYDERGVEISGGEAQKVALARALYKDAPFIILDEPTAALDPIAEYEIYSKFDSIVGGKTAVYISHRLSSCRFCDDIAVFHEGALIQRGSHDALLKETSGKYFELWNAQAQYYTDNGQIEQLPVNIS